MKEIVTKQGHKVFVDDDNYEKLSKIKWFSLPTRHEDDPLLHSKIDEGWYPVRIWHTTSKGVWHTHWIFERKMADLLASSR